MEVVLQVVRKVIEVLAIEVPNAAASVHNDRRLKNKLLIRCL